MFVLHTDREKGVIFLVGLYVYLCFLKDGMKWHLAILVGATL